MTEKKQILITTGDIDGIGQEITLKALKELPVNNKCRIVIYTSTRNKWPKSSGAWRFQHFKSQPENIETMNENQIAVVSSLEGPHFWVRAAAQRAMRHARSGVVLVNAPMSKDGKGRGHTEILKDVSGNSNLFMGFLGSKFNVCLGTTHIPISQVFEKLNANQIKNAYRAANRLNQLAGGDRTVKVLGLNPHCGESGTISRQDLKIKAHLPGSVGPLLVPDAAFISWKRKDTYLAWYHDQGLIPFKMAHGFSHGIQVTLGLPFIRTSVDHGTAKDIYGKGIANHKSLLLALKKGRQMMLKHGNTIIPSQEFK